MARAPLSSPALAFKTYVKLCHNRTGPEQDFIEDARSDTEMPLQLSCWRELRSYLENACNACQAAIEAARPVWKRYKSWKASRLSLKSAR